MVNSELVVLLVCGCISYCCLLSEVNKAVVEPKPQQIISFYRPQELQKFLDSSWNWSLLEIYITLVLTPRDDYVPQKQDFEDMKFTLFLFDKKKGSSGEGR